MFFQLDYCELGIFVGTAMFQIGKCHDDLNEQKFNVIMIAYYIFGHEDEEHCELVAVAQAT